VLPDFLKNPYVFYGEYENVTPPTNPEIGPMKLIGFINKTTHTQNGSDEVIAVFSDGMGDYKYAEWVLAGERDVDGIAHYITIRAFKWDQVEKKFVFEKGVVKKLGKH